MGDISRASLVWERWAIRRLRSDLVPVAGKGQGPQGPKGPKEQVQQPCLQDNGLVERMSEERRLRSANGTAGRAGGAGGGAEKGSF
jgi:hypothetical protein